MYKPKYKKVLESVFPSGPIEAAEPNAGNVSKLVYYAQMSPHKLPKIAKELEKRVHDGLRLRKINSQVSVAMKTFHELIRGCRENVPLFEDVLSKLMEGLCNDPSPEARCLAADCFVVYTDALVTASAAASRLNYDHFVHSFVSFAKAIPLPEQKNLRIRGLKALRACIRALELRDDLDAFVTRAGSSFISALLDNLRVSSSTANQIFLSSNIPLTSSSSVLPALPAVPSPASTPSTSASSINNNNATSIGSLVDLSMLALQCLQDLTERLKNLTIPSLTNGVLLYLDERNVWNDSPNFATQCLQSVARSIKAKDKPAMISTLVRHLDSSSSTTIAKRKVVVCITNVLGETQGPMSEILAAAIRHLAASVRYSLTSQTVISNADALKSETEFQKELIQAVGAVSKKLPATQPKIESLEYAMARLSENHLENDTPECNEAMSLALLNLMLEIASTITEPLRKPASESLVVSLLSLCQEKSCKVRLAALKVLHIVLSGGMLQNIMDSVSEKGATGADYADTPSSTDPILLRSDLIRKTMFTTITLKTNKPEQIWAAWCVLIILLARLRNKELPFSIPLIFELQELAFNKPSVLSKAIMTSVAGYLRVVARVYGRSALRDLVSQTIDKAKKEKKSCPELGFEHGLLIVKKEKFTKKTKLSAKEPLTIRFDREQVAEILCHVQSLSQEYKNLKQLLLSNWENTSKSAISSKQPTTTTTTTTTTPSVFASTTTTTDILTPSTTPMDILRKPPMRLQRSPSIAKQSANEEQSESVSFRNVSDILRPPKPKSTPTTAVSSTTTAKKQNANNTNINAAVTAPQNLSFARIAASCNNYAIQSRIGFDRAMNSVPKPSTAQTDFLNVSSTSFAVPVDSKLLDPEACLDIDFDHFVEQRFQHFPTLFEVFPSPAPSNPNSTISTSTSTIPN